MEKEDSKKPLKKSAIPRCTNTKQRITVECFILRCKKVASG
ncbi:hypothetical protein T03_17506 [Trichinella britovi]|uniref:Uncharacterized protein n=1 Tax=Trichinella britovi TaxID=45882 RepID=A0A0V0YU25_TRIBR|nr:hypothetical protein T03_17506 [Trichinella britovi]